MQTLKVESNEAGQRLDKLLTKFLSKAGKSFLYKMMRKKNITLNGKKCDGSEHLVQGDEIQIYFSDETIEKFTENPAAKPQKPSGKRSSTGPDLDIIYEDANVIIVNKPAGMLSQKAKEGDISLNEHILNYLIDSGHLPVSQLRTFRPSICNRLDRNTSGLVAAGTSLGGLQVMNSVFKDRSIHKYYQCLVKGQVKERQLIAGFLKKDEVANKVTVYPIEVEGSTPIMTEYLPLSGNGRYTLLQVTLITGKSHQIRAHLASIGHPILGDGKYGDNDCNQEMRRRYRVQSQLLHSWKLVMPEKVAEPLDYLSGKTFFAPLPPRFLKVMKGENIEFPPVTE